MAMAGRLSRLIDVVHQMPNMRVCVLVLPTGRPQPDKESMLACLDIVRYALGCSIFLGMPMEKAVFAKQLPKFL